MVESVLIVGCGVFGLSTAVELSSKGYSVVAIDGYAIPSPWSAANDYNKIIRSEYSDLFYSKLSLEAMESWRNDKELKTTYNECGRVSITPSHHKGRIEYEAKGKENLKRLGHGKCIESFVGSSQFGSKFKLFSDNKYEQSTVFTYNSECGLGHASKSLEIMAKKAKRQGTKFIFGGAGHAVKVMERDGETIVLTKNGQEYTADIIIISAGASTPNIINLNQQTFATGLFVSHIKLSEKEYQKYKDIPIIFSAEEGYFFPPDPETKILKVCISTVETYNEVFDQFGNANSLPRFKNEYPNDAIPQRFIADVSKLLSKTLPELAYHEVIDSKICWISDTGNSDFLIDKVPFLKNTFVATGDSGHAYKFLPNIGNYIRQRIEGTLDKEITQKWSWKASFNRNINWRVDRFRLNLSDNDNGNDEAKSTTLGS